MLNDAGTATEQLIVTFMGIGAVEVQMARTELAEDVFGNEGTQLHILVAPMEEQTIFRV